MLGNKTILVGVTGSIAAYKAASLVSMLVKNGADVHVLMTQNARNFINEITFERGASADDYLQPIYETLFHNNNCRSTVVIQICDRFGNVRREFQLAECWFSKYECGDLDATSDDVIIETLTMQLEYFL